MKNDVTLAPLRAEIIRRMLDDVDRIRDHAHRFSTAVFSRNVASWVADEAS